MMVVVVAAAHAKWAKAANPTACAKVHARPIAWAKIVVQTDVEEAVAIARQEKNAPPSEPV